MSAPEEMLAAIRDLTEELGHSPSLRQIGARIGVRGTVSVARRLKDLEVRGLIVQDEPQGRRRRNLRIVP